MFAQRPQLVSVAVPVIGAIVALILVWRILHIGLAQISYADAAVSPAAGEATQEAAAPAEMIWRAWLVSEPTNARWFVGLALALEEQGKRTEARAAIDEAMRLNATYPRVSLAAAQFYLREGDAAKALPILGRRMDLYPDRSAEVWPIFLAELESGRGTEYLLGAARQDPPWFSSFFSYACGKEGSLGIVVKLFTARSAAGVLADSERACLIGRMQRERHWAEARELWRKSLPIGEQENMTPLFNGDFERPLSNVGFDWITSMQDDVQVDTQPIDGAHGKLALRVAYNNTRYAGSPIRQYLILRPGRYVFSGLVRAEAFETWLGLQWGLYCVAENAGEERQLEHTEPFLGTLDWTPFRYEFSVPGDCDAQILRLELANPRPGATTPGNVTVRLRGTLRFDNLAIRALD